MKSDMKKFQENNAELAKALVEHKQIIGELKIESLKYQHSYFDLYNENRLLKTQLTFAKKTIVNLFKANTENYTDVMRKLGIALTDNNSTSKSMLSSASPNPVSIQRHSPNREKRLATEPIVQKKFASKVRAEKKDSHGENPFGQPNAGLLNIEVQLRKDQLHESIKSKPKLIITPCSDDEDEELNISHTHSESNVKRSPVGRKMNYDEEANTSLRELKEKKLCEKLSPVPDEINKMRILSPSTKITAYNATERSEQAHHVAQARLAVINKAKSPINESKSPKNIIRNNEAASHFTAPSPKSAQHQTTVEFIAKFTSTPQLVVTGERKSGKSVQLSRSSHDPSSVHSNSTGKGSSRNKENYLNPITLLKRLQRHSLVSYTPKKLFVSPKRGVSPTITVPKKSPQVDVPNYQYHSHRRDSPINMSLLQAEHKETRQTMSIKPIKKSPQSVQQTKLNIETSIENKGKSLSQKAINNLSEAKENNEIAIFEPTLHKSAHRNPLKTVQSPNISLVSDKSLGKSSTARNVVCGFQLPNDNDDALKDQKSIQSMERQSNALKRRVRSRTKSKENIPIDDEQPHVRAPNSHADEHHSLSHNIAMQSEDSNERRARFRTSSSDNISIDDEQLNYSERPRRQTSTTNYAEPKLNTKMRRKF